jgi:hypothetical protein
MNRHDRSKASGLKIRNCRNLLAPSRVRRQAMAEKFDQQWRELRRCSTIEGDQQKLAKLRADWKSRTR